MDSVLRRNTDGESDAVAARPKRYGALEHHPDGVNRSLVSPEPSGFGGNYCPTILARSGAAAKTLEPSVR
jgi:hypothetical protein